MKGRDKGGGGKYVCHPLEKILRAPMARASDEHGLVELSAGL